MTTLLVIAIALLLFLVLVFVGRANELAQTLKGEDKDTSGMSRFNGIALMAFILVFFVGIAYSFKVLLPIMIPKAASAHGVETDFLFYLTLFFIGIVFVLTQLALFYFAYRYNEAYNKKAYFYSHNNKLEVIWTVIPAITMTVLVVMGMKVWFKIFDESSRDKEKMMVIEVTAKQFNWTVRYPGKDAQFGERIIDKEHISPTNELGINWEDRKSQDDFMADKIYLVKNRPVLCKLGALDVLHSFYLPHFRVKMDCVPGIPTQFYFTPTMTTKEMQEYLSTQPWWQTINPETGEARWKTFKYELACAELCGKSHYGMQKEVVVVEQEEYDAWMRSQASYYETVVKPAMANNTPAGESSAQETSKEAAGPQAMLLNPGK